MGVTMGRNGARAPRTGTTMGTGRNTNEQLRLAAGGRGRRGGAGLFDGLAALFGGLWAVFVIAWWIIKVVAVVIFVVTGIQVAGALINNNPVEGAQIGWLIGSFIAAWIL